MTNNVVALSDETDFEPNVSASNELDMEHKTLFKH